MADKNEKTNKNDKRKLNKDELKGVSGGAVFRAKISDVQKVRNLDKARVDHKPGSGRGLR